MFKTIRSKIILAILIALLFLSGLSLINLNRGFTEMVDKSAKEELGKLNALLYEGLKVAMNTGDSGVIEKFIKGAKGISGIKEFEVYPAKETIELFGIKEPFTQDNAILRIFSSKQSEIDTHLVDNGVDFLMRRPILAEESCLNCHVNVKVGEPLAVVGMKIFYSDAIRDSIQMRLFGWLVFATVVILVAIFWFCNYWVFHPIDRLRIVAQDLAAGDGDLRRRLQIKGQDEIGLASSYINAFIEKIASTIQEAKNVSLESITQSKDLADASGEIKDRIGQSVNAINQSTALSKQLATVLKESVALAQDGATQVISSAKMLEQTQNTLEEIVADIQRDSQAEEDIANHLNMVAREAESIKNILTLLTDVVEQTNLLSFNANIEAARAGESGRGFAVVADEIGKLAYRTQKSLVEINATITQAVKAITDVTKTMNENTRNIDKLAHQSLQSKEVLEKSVQSLQAALNSSNASVTKINELERGFTEILNRIHLVESLIQENSQKIGIIDNGTHEIAQKCQKLNTKLEDFKS